VLTKTDIALLAAGHLGSTVHTINIDTGTTSTEKVFRHQFPISLEALLRRHRWTMATKFGALTEIDEDPTDGFAYAYTAPDDCLVIRKIGYDSTFYDIDEREDEKLRWRIVNSEASPNLLVVYTDIEDAEIEYTKLLNANGRFQNHFAEALAAQLAMDAASRIITNNFSKVKTVLLSELRGIINRGISDDLAMQPLPEQSESKFLAVRRN